MACEKNFNHKHGRSTSCVKIFEFFIIFCWLISLKSSCELLSSLCVHPSFVKFSHFNLPPFPLAYYMTGIRLVTKCYKCCRQIKKKYLVWNNKKKKKKRNWSCLWSIFCHKSIISDQYNKNTVKKTPHNNAFTQLPFTYIFDLLR